MARRRSNPKHSMQWVYGICTYIGVVLGVNVGIYMAYMMECMECLGIPPIPVTRARTLATCRQVWQLHRTNTHSEMRGRPKCPDLSRIRWLCILVLRLLGTRCIATFVTSALLVVTRSERSRNNIRRVIPWELNLDGFFCGDEAARGGGSWFA